MRDTVDACMDDRTVRPTGGRKKIGFHGAPSAIGYAGVNRNYSTFVQMCRWFSVLMLVTLPYARAEGAIVLSDVTRQTGIVFRHNSGGSGRYYIVETVASGLATFDYDGDGLIDIYFLNGSSLPGATVDTPSRNALYRNVGGFRFVDVTEEAGVGDPGHGLGVCVADYDNDGDADMFVNNFGPNVLYRNNGNGTFTDVTSSAGLGRESAVGAGANFLDFDADGDLDLFVSNYIRFTYENHVTTTIREAPWYAGPRDFPLQPNRLYRNNSDGTFTDVSEESGIAAHAGAGMGTICFDYDRDGDTDIFVCNDQHWDFLFQNDGRGRFQEVGLFAGVACNYAGEPVGSMGADCADYDHNGWLDLFMTDFELQKPVLFCNRGRGMFDDVAMKAGVAVGSFAFVKWGSSFVDFDNDGHTDLFVGCGHLGEDLNEAAGRVSSYEVCPVVLRNGGAGRFADVSDNIGTGSKTGLVARGVAADDLDNDGRVDVVILSLGRGPTVLRNESAPDRHWIAFCLRGIESNRDGVGARVVVQAGGLRQTSEVHSGRGYQSHFGTQLHFGLGDSQRVDRVEINWIGGRTDVLTDLRADKRYTITEGSGEASAAD